MAVVYVWGPGRDAYGHASLLLENGTYISWWPLEKEDPKKIARGKRLEMLGKRGHYKVKSYGEDVKLEKKEAERQIRLPRGALKEAKITAWWNSYEDMYDGLTNNCATVVYRALCEGEAIVPPTAAERALSKFGGPWMPETIGDYAEEITTRL